MTLPRPDARSIREGVLKGFSPAISPPWLALFLAVDVAFILFHILVLPHRPDLWYDFNVVNDRNWPERFNYLKWATVAAVGAILFHRTKDPLFAVWAALFAWLLVDDSMSGHEHAGRFIVAHVDVAAWNRGLVDLFPDLRLRDQDLGELAFAVLLAGLICISVSLAWARGRPQEGRRFTFVALAWCVLFGVFAVGVDMLHSAMPQREELLALIEDGGEMLTASLLVGMLFGELRRVAAAPSR